MTTVGDAGAPGADLATLVQHITGATSAAALAQTLRTFAPDEHRELVLAGMLPGMQDPLALLNIEANTLGVLFILCVRRVDGVGFGTDERRTGRRGCS
jgi:hypothetical protein